LGADVNSGAPHDTPLQAAIWHPHTVRTLLDHGARLDFHSYRGGTALRKALRDCNNAHITAVVPTAQLLLDAGAAVPDDAAELVAAIGRRFEFWREGFNPKYLAETDAALSQLYAMFGVPPAPRRRRHDGVSPIVVTATTVDEQFDELWELLVPTSGPAATQQGEVIRLAGRISREILTNGGINWDRDYRRMTTALVTLLGTGTAVADRAELATLAQSVTTEISLNRLCALAVAWVLANPQPTDLPPPPYDY
jgi:hypothetical protein